MTIPIDSVFPKKWNPKLYTKHVVMKDTIEMQLFLTYNGRRIRIDDEVRVEDLFDYQTMTGLAIALHIRETFDRELMRGFPNV